MNKRLLAIPLAAAAAATIAVVATNTGADFSSTSNPGTISGTNGRVTVIGNHGGSLDISFGSGMVPGIVNTVSVTFTNSGNVPEDIYVEFPNAQALHAFDQEGRFAQANIQADGNTTWSSQNINDGLQAGANPAGPYNCATATNLGDPQICPLSVFEPLLTNVGAGQTHTFTFNYLENSTVQGLPKNVGNGAQGAVFNAYPVGTSGNANAGTTSSGLPYEFYAIPTGTGQGVPVVPLTNANDGQP
jgi:hypothetical protein